MLKYFSGLCPTTHLAGTCPAKSTTALAFPHYQWPQVHADGYAIFRRPRGSCSWRWFYHLLLGMDCPSTVMTYVRMPHFTVALSRRGSALIYIITMNDNLGMTYTPGIAYASTFCFSVAGVEGAAFPLDWFLCCELSCFRGIGFQELL